MDSFSIYLWILFLEKMQIYDIFYKIRREKIKIKQNIDVYIILCLKYSIKVNLKC